MYRYTFSRYQKTCIMFCRICIYVQFRLHGMYISLYSHHQCWHSVLHIIQYRHLAHLPTRSLCAVGDLKLFCQFPGLDAEGIWKFYTRRTPYQSVHNLWSNPPLNNITNSPKNLGMRSDTGSSSTIPIVLNTIAINVPKTFIDVSVIFTSLWDIPTTTWLLLLVYYTERSVVFQPVFDLG